MCVVSAIFDYGRTVPQEQWTQKGFYEFKELIKRAEEFDREMDQPDCEDPEKKVWMEEVEERLRKLEEGKAGGGQALNLSQTTSISRTSIIGGS